MYVDHVWLPVILLSQPFRQQQPCGAEEQKPPNISSLVLAVDPGLARVEVGPTAHKVEADAPVLGNTDLYTGYGSIPWHIEGTQWLNTKPRIFDQPVMGKNNSHRVIANVLQYRRQRPDHIR